jgi:nucleotide-binding universal stress UspA family protein
MLEHAAKRLAEWRRTLTGLTVKANVRSGTPYYEIVRAAEETNTDLIVLSTHGRTGLAHVFIGSNAERVVRHAPCPVLVVRQREHDFLSAADSGTATSTNRLKGAHYGNRTQKK